MLGLVESKAGSWLELRPSCLRRHQPLCCAITITCEYTIPSQSHVNRVYSHVIQYTNLNAKYTVSNSKYIIPNAKHAIPNAKYSSPNTKACSLLDQSACATNRHQYVLIFTIRPTVVKAWQPLSLRSSPSSSHTRAKSLADQPSARESRSDPVLPKYLSQLQPQGWRGTLILYICRPARISNWFLRKPPRLLSDRVSPGLSTEQPS